MGRGDGPARGRFPGGERTTGLEKRSSASDRHRDFPPPSARPTRGRRPAGPPGCSRPAAPVMSGREWPGDLGPGPSLSAGDSLGTTVSRLAGLVGFRRAPGRRSARPSSEMLPESPRPPCSAGRTQGPGAKTAVGLAPPAPCRARPSLQPAPPPSCAPGQTLGPAASSAWTLLAGAPCPPAQTPGTSLPLDPGKKGPCALEGPTYPNTEIQKTHFPFLASVGSRHGPEVQQSLALGVGGRASTCILS